MSVTLLIQRVQADVGVHLAYAVLLDLLLTHVQQVEHLHLLGFDFVAEGYIELDMCPFGKPQHAQIVAAEDVMALHPIDKDAEDVLLLGVREHCLAFALVADLPAVDIFHRVDEIKHNVSHAPQCAVYDHS